ncbi:MAG: radical SAM protein [Planctomycetes bacterium]|nr:radical SAM protein [Planctomycetota bacterium]
MAIKHLLSGGRKRILLVMPPYTAQIYEKIDRRAGTMQNPTVTFATVAAPLIEAGHQVEVVDLDVYPSPLKTLKRRLDRLEPHIVGLTAVTPLYANLLRIAKLVREWRPDVSLVAGGVHITLFPEAAVEEAGLDMAVIGEGDFTLRDVLDSKDPLDTPGVCLRDDGEVIHTSPRPLIQDLDSLGMPAWRLYDIRRYHATHLLEIRSPGGLIETSRGCPFGCTYCDKTTFGRTFRAKSVGRTIAEIEHMLRVGFREIHVVDECFTMDMERAKEICREIIRRGLRFPWSAFGVRVDRLDNELMALLKRSGCHQLGFGVETGNAEVMKRIRKRITLDQVRRATGLAHRHGIETLGYFMLGLPGDTEATMQDTVRFAVDSGLDLAKFSITVPFPGSPLYRELEASKAIKSRDWRLYSQHNVYENVYDHPNADWGAIIRSYKRAHRHFYFRPVFIAKRMVKSALDGNLFRDMFCGAATRWF